ncbi:MAG: ABC transporter ATP-binding protein [Propionibacteriaceae bacterium]|nr:ABC transporter ATP-binding protein [Propionibacteriaceae bacterium]
MIERDHRQWSLAQRGLSAFLLHLQAIQSGIIEIVTMLGGLAVMVVGRHLAQSGQLAPTLVPLAMLSSFGPVTDIAKVAKQIAEPLTASRRVFAVHDEPVLPHDGPVRQLPAAVWSVPSVTFESVTFSYGVGETPARQDVTFSIDAGQTVALDAG